MTLPDIQKYLESALSYDNLKHYFIIKFAQKPGELKRFVDKILGPNDDITRFEYIKKNKQVFWPVLVGIELSDPDNLLNIRKKLKRK